MLYICQNLVNASLKTTLWCAFVDVDKSSHRVLREVEFLCWSGRINPRMVTIVIRRNNEPEDRLCCGVAVIL